MYKQVEETSKAICMKMVPFAMGDLCFVKVKGYPAWPAFVIGIENNIIEVEFFNSGET